jgi:hypothetical protein
MAYFIVAGGTRIRRNIIPEERVLWLKRATADESAKDSK